MTGNIFSERLSALRNGRPRRLICEELKVRAGTLAAYESGIREPNLDTLKMICEFFHVSADYLLGLSDSKTITVNGSQNVVSSPAGTVNACCASCSLAAANDRLTKIVAKLTQA